MPQASTTFDDYKIDETIRQNQRLHNQEICGTRWLSEVKAENGKRKTFALKCKVWRNPLQSTEIGCVPCFEDRWKLIRARVAAALVEARNAETTLQACEVSAESERSLRGKIKRRGSDFLRLPTLTSTLYFFFAQEDLPGEPYSAIDFGDEDWERVAFTPEGKRISGNLGRPNDDEDDDDRVSVELPAVITTEIEDKTVDQCWEETLAETCHLLPITLDEVIDAVEERMETFVMLLQNAVAEKEMTLGCNWLDAHARASEQIKLVRKFQRVSIASIDWESPTSNY